MQLDIRSSIKGDLGGIISISIKENKSLIDFCIDKIPGYDPDRFEIMALRYYSGVESFMTLYVIDNYRLEGTNFTPEKVPVKKIKLTGVKLDELLPYIDEFNFTITTGNYPIEDMEVINK